RSCVGRSSPHTTQRRERPVSDAPTAAVLLATHRGRCAGFSALSPSLPSCRSAGRMAVLGRPRLHRCAAKTRRGRAARQFPGGAPLADGADCGQLPAGQRKGRAARQFARVTAVAAVASVANPIAARIVSADPLVEHLHNGWPGSDAPRASGRLPRTRLKLAWKGPAALCLLPSRVGAVGNPPCLVGAPSSLFFRQRLRLILRTSAQADYGDKWPPQ